MVICLTRCNNTKQTDTITHYSERKLLTGLAIAALMA